MAFLRAIANDLRSLANDVENHLLHDFLHFRLDGLMDDLAQLNGDTDVEVDPAALDSRQEVARQLNFLSETEEDTIGRPTYILPPV